MTPASTPSERDLDSGHDLDNRAAQFEEPLPEQARVLRDPSAKHDQIGVEHRSNGDYGHGQVAGEILDDPLRQGIVAPPSSKTTSAPVTVASGDSASATPRWITDLLLAADLNCRAIAGPLAMVSRLPNWLKSLARKNQSTTRLQTSPAARCAPYGAGLARRYPRRRRFPPPGRPDWRLPARFRTNTHLRPGGSRRFPQRPGT